MVLTQSRGGVGGGDLGHVVKAAGGQPQQLGRHGRFGADGLPDALVQPTQPLCTENKNIKIDASPVVLLHLDSTRCITVYDNHGHTTKAELGSSVAAGCVTRQSLVYP